MDATESGSTDSGTTASAETSFDGRAIYWLIAWRPCVQRAEARKWRRSSDQAEARKDAAQRSPTMAAAEPMAAVERVRTLADPVRASEQRRKGTRRGPRGAIYSRE